MNYIEKKEELVKFRDEILRDYQSLLNKTLRFQANALKLTKMPTTFNEIIDLESFIAREEATMKITSLAVALMYVEYPEDIEVVNSLKRDININRYGRR